MPSKFDNVRAKLQQSRRALERLRSCVGRDEFTDHLTLFLVSSVSVNHHFRCLFGTDLPKAI
jgi:hypothetical protein